MRFLAVLLIPILLVLSGCGAGIDTPAVITSQAKLDGSVRGGQQPISGARVYVLAANTGGYGGTNIPASTANASVALLDAAKTGSADAIGAYATTDAYGSFSLSGEYTCTPGQGVYLYSLGGNTGAGVNPAAGLLAVLGTCPSSGSFAASVPFLEVNEVTTIAAAYALAGFSTDSTHISSLNAPLSIAGLTNAFHHASNLANVANGSAVALTPAARDTVALQTINTLANALAACVNSLQNSPACNTLFQNVDSSTHAGLPADTATAAIYLAQNPDLNASQISSIYDLGTATSPFSPALKIQPTTFEIKQSLTPTSYSALGDSITCGYVSGQPFSDCNTAFAYPSLLAAAYNVPLTNPAYPGDQACDLWPVQIGPHQFSPSLADGGDLATLMIGTNDADAKGAGSYESTFKLCDAAAVAWMAIPAESKALPAAASLDSGWSRGSTYQIGPMITSSTPGSVATFSLPTYGGPVMLWYVFQDNTAGEISYSIDGGTPTLLSTEANPAMATQNGAVGSISMAVTGALSGSVTAPVTHTITITNVAGTAYVIGTGTPPMTSFFGHPVLGVTDVPYDGPGGPVNTSAAASYSSDAQAIAAQMQSYGLDVRYGSTHAYLTGQASEFQGDEVHPNSVGAAHLFAGVQNILQPN